MNADHHLLQVLSPCEEPSGLDLEFVVIAGKAAHVTATIRALELTRHCRWREAISCQTLPIQNHSYLPRLASYERRVGNIVDLFERVFQLAGDAAQVIRVIVLPPQSERHDGDVVDRSHLNDRL